jgi:hypothetical protein
VAVGAFYHLLAEFTAGGVTFDFADHGYLYTSQVREPVSGS